MSQTALTSPQAQGTFTDPRLAHYHRFRIAVILALCLLAAASTADHLGLFGYPGDDHVRFDKQTVFVTRLIDGNTVAVRLPHSPKEITVHLLGLAPATDNHTLDTLAPLLAGHSAILRLPDLQTRDDSGRLLAYLYTLDNENLNLQLLRQGLARADATRDHPYRALFEAAQSNARYSHGRGEHKSKHQSEF